jgi:hypothetical protein
MVTEQSRKITSEAELTTTQNITDSLLDQIDAVIFDAKVVKRQYYGI